ncbi:MAG: YDG domain-containing protein [Treponema sp.]|nr:YDG domain-containing protein [Treponema sp.]
MRKPALFVVLCSLFFVIACQNPFTGVPQQKQQAIPAGMGALSVQIDTARTIVPNAALGNFKFKLILDEEEIFDDYYAVLERETFYLAAGEQDYELVVIAYLPVAGLGSSRPVATVTREITIIAGETTYIAITIPLVANNTAGKGLFTFGITFNDPLPSALHNASMTVEPLPGTVEDTHTVHFYQNGAEVLERVALLDLESGYYQVTFNLEKTGHFEPLVWQEILHIYENMVSDFEHSFFDSDFNVTKYTITFYRNDGTNGWYARQTRAHGEEAVNIAVPPRPGYNFVEGNWFEKEGENLKPARYNFDEPVESNIALYAKWTPILDEGTAGISVGGDGILKIGAVLNAVTSTITAGEGDVTNLPGAGFTYEWRRWNMARTNFTTAILGTDPTYTVTGADAGRMISCVITHTGTGVIVYAGIDGDVTATTAIVPYTIVIDPIVIIKDELTGVEANALAADKSLGLVGEIITLTYTLARPSFYNEITFEFDNIEYVDELGPGVPLTDELEYTVRALDADQNGEIIIVATFTHTDLDIIHIHFEKPQSEIEPITYGDNVYTNAIVPGHPGSGTLTYSSSNTEVATVNSSGVVSILRAGTVHISAVKAADAVYARVSASYSLTIDRKTLAWDNTGTVADKDYDRTTTVTAVTKQPGLTGFVNAETVDPVYGTVRFADANAGTSVAVIAQSYSIASAGPYAGNYDPPENPPVFAPAAIRPLRLTWNANGVVNDKEYDGTGSASVLTQPTLAGILSPDSVTRVYGTVSFDDSNVGPTVGITASGYGINDASGNYAPPLDQPVFAAAQITPKPLTIINVAHTKVYDGDATIPEGVTVTLIGNMGTDDIDVEYDNIPAAYTGNTAGTSTVTVNAADVIPLLSGDDAGNYTVAQPAEPVENTLAGIRRRPLGITPPTAPAAWTKVYDGNTVYSGTITEGDLTNNTVAGDTITVTVASANFNNANVTEANAITIVYAIDSASEVNYIRPGNTSINSGVSITPAAGWAVGIPNAAMEGITDTSITIVAVNKITPSPDAPNTQTVEYARSTTAGLTGAPLNALAWQSGLTFTGLTPNTDYYVYARSAADDDNYTVGPASQSAAIRTNALSLTGANFTASNLSWIYGDPDKAVTAGYTTGVVDGHAVNQANAGTITVHYISTDGGVAYSLNDAVPTNAGTYYIRVTTSGGAIFAAITTPIPLIPSVALTIEPKPITVTPTAGQTKVYGNPDPVDGFAYTITAGALVPGDIFSGALSRVTPSNHNVGSYNITQGTFTIVRAAGGAPAVSNYDLTVTAGVPFGITARSVTITPNPGQSKTYNPPDYADPPLSYTPSEERLSGNAESGALDRASGNNVGSYAIGPGDLSWGSNYTLILNATTVSFTINPAEITTAAITVSTPATAAPVSTTATGTGNFTLSAVTWAPSGHAVFQGSTVYTATVTLTAAANYVFAGTLTTPTISGGAATVPNNTGSTVTLSRVFSITGAKTVTGIAVIAEPTLVSYIHGDTPNLAGLQVRLTYSDSSTEVVAFADFEDHNIETNPSSTTVLSRATHHGQPIAVSCGDPSANTSRTLTVGQKTLTITGVNATNRAYSTAAPPANTTVALTGGTLVGVIADDADNVGFTRGSGTITTPNAGGPYPVTTDITLSGTAASNYTLTQPTYVTVTITKAAGGAVSAPTRASGTTTSITINAVPRTTANAEQAGVEYAISTATPFDASQLIGAWQTGLTFSGLTANTNYYVYARSQESDNYSSGTPTSSLAINTGLSFSIVYENDTNQLMKPPAWNNIVIDLRLPADPRELTLPAGFSSPEWYLSGRPGSDPISTAATIDLRSLLRTTDGAPAPGQLNTLFLIAVRAGVPYQLEIDFTVIRP